MSYLFIYTIQQEMKLQTCSCGSGILPGSWGIVRNNLLWKVKDG